MGGDPSMEIPADDRRVTSPTTLVVQMVANTVWPSRRARPLKVNTPPSRGPSTASTCLPPRGSGARALTSSSPGRVPSATSTATRGVLGSVMFVQAMVTELRLS